MSQKDNTEKGPPGTHLEAQFMKALDAQFGYFPGKRAIHAKGFGTRGVFRPTGAASEFTSAEHLRRSPDGVGFKVVARFSNGDGNPHASDGDAFSRGFAVRFEVPGKGFTDLLSIVSPIFITDDPEVFLAFIQALKPDKDSKKPRALSVAAFAARHPITMGHVIAQQRKEVPKSFATTQWHAVHAFELTDASGRKTHARFRWVPVAPEETIPREDTRAIGVDYLTDDARSRLKSNSIEFDLHLSVAEDGDPLDRPDLEWNSEAKSIALGRLSLIEEYDAELLCFSPGNLISGISPPTDAIFPARLNAYSASQHRRRSPVTQPGTTKGQS